MNTYHAITPKTRARHTSSFARLNECPTRQSEPELWRVRWNSFRDGVTIAHGEAYWEQLSSAYEQTTQQDDLDTAGDLR